MIVDEPHILNLGPIPFAVSGPSQAKNRFIRVHGDETTAGEILQLLAESGERCYSIINGTRNFTENGVQFNPNRIFSPEGARADLRRLNPSASSGDIEDVLDTLDRDRSSFLENIFSPDGGLLTALHNNFESYSIRSELDRSNSVHFPERDRPRDFYITVNTDDYDRLSQGPFNVVLQNAPGNNDGSLSWAALAAGVRYVNIETERGLLKRQQSMVDWLRKVLG